jgi:hypothetical protein
VASGSRASTRAEATAVDGTEPVACHGDERTLLTGWTGAVGEELRESCLRALRRR